MFLRTATTKSTNGCWDKAAQLREALDRADAVQIGSGDGEWEIPLDGSCLRVEYKNMILLFPAKKKHMVILPLRCVEPGVLPEVQAMLVSGTHRESD